MKKIILFALLAISFCTNAQTAGKFGQLWNVANGYYGTVNSTTIDNSTIIDSFKGTTAYLSLAFWERSGSRAYDSARILSRGQLPYTQGLVGWNTLSISLNVLKASTTSTVTPTVVLNIQQSPNGVNGWVTVPGVSTQTVSPTSRTTASTATFNIADFYNKYFRVSWASTDTSSGNAFFNAMPKD